MLTPSYLLHATEPAEEIAEKLHADILRRIIERILARQKRGDEYILTAVDKWHLETLQEAGYLLSDIQKELATATKLMVTEIAEAMEDAGVRALDYDDKVYRDAGLDPVPLTQSPHLISIMQRDYEATVGEWKNFTRTAATAAQQTFIRACDDAYHLAMTGAVSPSQAVAEAIEKLIDEGLQIRYSNGRTDTIQTAVTRAVRTGISQAAGHIQTARMDEMGWDLVVVSSHLGARPDHQVWQGKVYSRSGGGEYPDFVESTQYGSVTGLKGANCRHSFGPYFEGMDNPWDQYDKEENLKVYEAEQRRNELERRMAKKKQELIDLDTAINSAADNEQRDRFQRCYDRKAATLQRQKETYEKHCEEHGFKRRADRVAVYKWDRSQAEKARAAAKRYAEDHPDSVVPKAYKPKEKPMRNKADLFSLEERRKKLSVKQASSISEAIEIATNKGVRYARFEKMDLAQVNNMLNAVDTLPDDCKPAMIANGKDISLATQRPLGRKADQWWGVTYDYRDFSIATMHLGYDTTDYNGGLLVGFNTTKYKTLDTLTKAKVENNKKYFTKTGRNWSFNTDGRATAYHEFGHCFVDVRGLPKDWELLSEKWAEESKCDVLRKPDEAFAEAWAAFYLGDERLPKYISDAIIEAIGE